jgi:hypothetical protein
MRDIRRLMTAGYQLIPWSVINTAAALHFINLQIAILKIS